MIAHGLTRDVETPEYPPLTGFRIAVTSARRVNELAALLEKRGARVTTAAALVLDLMPDDDELQEQTLALIRDRPDMVIATTGIGFRAWIAAAEGWGLAPELLKALGSARIFARGPKAVGAIRAAGLSEEWVASTESSDELIDYVVRCGVADRRIAVQMRAPGDAQDLHPDLVGALGTYGAHVTPVEAYGWRLPPTDSDFDELVRGIARQTFDAVTFTSAPAAMSVLGRARQLGIEDAVASAMRTHVRCICVGPTAARPLTAAELPVSMPHRPRLGELVRHISDELPRIHSRIVEAAGHRVEIRSICVLVDGVVKPVTPAGMTIMRTLVKRPGRVVSRAELLAALPRRGSHLHAVESAIDRLRKALGDKDIVAAVTKRGYRLAVDVP